MGKRKIVDRPIDIEADGVSIAGGVNAVVTTGAPGEDNKVSARQRVRVVQRDGKTVVNERTTEVETSDDAT